MGFQRDGVQVSRGWGDVLWIFLRAHHCCGGRGLQGLQAALVLIHSHICSAWAMAAMARASQLAPVRILRSRTCSESWALRNTQPKRQDRKEGCPYEVVHRHLEQLSKVFKYVKCTRGWKYVFIILKLFIKWPSGCDYPDSEIDHCLYRKVSYISPPPSPVLTSVMSSVATIFTIIFTGFNTRVCIPKQCVVRLGFMFAF